MSTTRPILVTGAQGQLARALVARAERERLPLVALGRPELDLAGMATIDRVVTALTPRAIINTAAYTAVDRAEVEPAQAFAVNLDGAARLAAHAAQAHIPFIQLSTDYVFDGQKTSPYCEADRCAPLGVYGRSKQEGEAAVLAACRNAVVLRTSWVYGPHGVNFVKTMLRLASSQPVVRVVDDQHGAPTAASDLAGAILSILAQLTGRDGAGHGGIYHVTAQGATTWHGFAAAIFAGLMRRGQKIPRLEPIATADYPTPARRPANSRLDCDKLARAFAIRLPPWEISLEACLDQIFAEQLEMHPC